MKYVCMLATFGLLACSHIQPQFLKNISENKATSIYETGNEYFEDKDFQNAASEFKKVVDNYPGTDAYEPSLYLLAFSHFKTDDYETAIVYGRKFADQFPHSIYYDNILAMLGESYFKLADDYNAVYYLSKYYLVSEDTASQRSALGNILAALPEISKSKLEKLHKNFIADPIDEHILFFLVRSEINAGLEDDAQRDFNLLTRRFPNTLYKFEFGDYQKTTGLGETTGRAGVLLPLTGRFSVYGAELTKVIEVFVKNKYLSFTVFVRDTKSDPIEAIIQAADLVDDQHVDFIIGPMFSIEAFGVSGFTNGKGIPMIIPTALEPRFEALPNVYATGQNHEKQAQLIARYATRQLDLVRFAIIYPDNVKYAAIGSAFASEVKKNNGEIVAVESFNPDSITLKWQFERIKKKDPEVIFLAMDTDMIINTAPQAAYYGLEKIKLLGIESFNTERVPRLGEKYVENAIFIAPASIDSSALNDLKANGLKDDDPIAVRFFQTLWQLRDLDAYSRINVNEKIALTFKEKQRFNIFQIRNGEFYKLTDLSSDN